MNKNFIEKALNLIELYSDLISSEDQTNFISELMKNKLLTIRASENIIRILPPLNVKKSEIDQAIKIINKVCKTYKSWNIFNNVYYKFDNFIINNTANLYN